MFTGRDHEEKVGKQAPGLQTAAAVSHVTGRHSGCTLSLAQYYCDPLRGRGSVALGIYYTRVEHRTQLYVLMGYPHGTTARLCHE